MIITCLTLALLFLVVAPPVAALADWARRSEPRPLPLAAVGAALMLFSFFALPWLSLQPLRYAELDWLYDLAPLAREILGWLGIDDLERLLPIWRAFGFLTHPRGWLALILSRGPLVWLAVFFLGGVAFMAAQGITWRPGARWLGAVLLASATALLFILLFDLTLIDGLGEHSFPNWSAVIQPALSIHLHPVGPLITTIALLLQAVGGWQAFSRAAPEAFSQFES